MRFGWLAVVFFASIATSCRAPTQITFDITTDVACSEVHDTAFTTGPLALLADGGPPKAVAQGCASTGRIGSVVVVPSGADTDVVAVQIVTGVDLDVATCGPNTKCIVARRAIRFLPNTPLVVNVNMSVRCEGVECAGDQTCEDGECVSAIIVDPSACEGTGCNGDVLTPVDGGTQPSDAGVDATLPVDASGDAPPPVDAQTDASDASTCVPACTLDASQCVSATTIQACAPSACPSWGITTTCPSPLDLASYVCERYGSPSCVDPDWAEWPMPSDLADPTAPNPASYVDNEDGTVSDAVTGLMWQQGPAPWPDGGAPDGDADGQFSPSAGASYCSTLTLAGHRDWRVPSLIELVSILDLAVSPTIDATFFPGTPTDTFLSSTVLFNTGGGAWVLDFGAGATGGIASGQTSYVRCVR